MAGNAPERPLRALLILAAMFGGLYWLYVAERGDSDTKFHVYCESGSDGEDCAVTITNKDTDEVVQDASLKRGEGLTYRAKDTGSYEIKVDALEKTYTVDVYARDAGGTKDVLIYVNKKSRRSELDKVWLTPVFYLTETGAAAKARLSEYAKKYPEYEYSSTYNKLPVRVDYGFSEGVPTRKQTENGKEAYYVLADQARLGRIDRVGGN